MEKREVYMNIGMKNDRFIKKAEALKKPHIVLT